MVIVRKTVGIVVGIIGLGVLIHFVFSPFYADSVDMGQAWNIANWFMAFGMIVAILFGIHLRKSAEDLAANDPKRICAEIALYSIMALAILFFWNMIDNLTVDEQSQTRRNWWPFINTAFIILMGYVSDRLVRSR